MKISIDCGNRVYRFLEKIRVWRHRKNLHTCPSRINHPADNPQSIFGRKDKNKDVDYWRKQGNDTCCSFCGSWNPEEFFDYINRCQDNFPKDDYVEYNPRKGKFYVHRNSVRNALEGAVKLYGYHLKSYTDSKKWTKKQIKEMDQKIHNILIESHKRFISKKEPEITETDKK